MSLLLATHESSLRHDTGSYHPERPQRVTAVIDGITGSGVAVAHVAPEPASRELLTAVHSESYVDAIERFCAAGGGALDPDTVAGPDSWEAALRAAGAGPAVCAELESGTSGLGYVAMRPPGHHAVRERAMGFCLFNNAAVTAAYLTAAGHKVAIVDWDVHHGNGTQDLFYDDPATLYLSIHEEGIYPGTGGLREAGAGGGRGNNVNIPVPAGTGGGFYRRAFAELVVPVVEQFAPDWLLVSSGYDAHRDDPLANLRLLSGDYGAMACGLAGLGLRGRTVVFLEGGYDLAALERSAAATVRGFLDPGYVVDPETDGIDPERYLDRAAEAVMKHWHL